MADDRVTVKVEFRKAWWICPFCGYEEVTDLNIGTPNVYEIDCGSCGKHHNNFKDYNSILTYDPKDYETADVAKDKTTKIDNWIYDVKNPLAEVKPTLEQLREQKIAFENMKTETETKISELSAAITAEENKP
jgi:hypothetical protein